MSNQQDSSSKGWTIIITSVIGVIGTIAVAYFVIQARKSVTPETYWWPFFASFMVLFFLLFLVIAFSWFMSDLLGSAAMGFLCGGGVFLLILLLAVVFRKALFLNPLIRLFIQTSTQEEEDEFY